MPVSKMRAISAILLAVSLAIPISAMAQAREWIYQMQPGDNLWNISRDYLADVQNWRKLKKLNNIRNHRRIPPGTRIRIPVTWLKVKPLTARALSVNGDVVASSDKSGQDIALIAGTHLSAGDDVRTGSGASALLEFTDGSRLLLQRNSQLHLESTNAYGSKANVIENRVRLESGRIEAEVPNQNNPNGGFEIRSPAATTGGLGVRYRVNMDHALSRFRIEVIEGNVQVSGAGEGIVVSNGFGTVVTRGQSPQTPLPLLAPPDLSLLPSNVEGLPYELEWPALEGAQAYRSQLRPHDNPATLLADKIHENPRLRIANIEDGDYLLAVRGIDAYKLEGLVAEHQLALSMLSKHTKPTIPSSKSMTKNLDRPPTSRTVSATTVQLSQLLQLLPIVTILFLIIPALTVLLT